MNRKLFLTLVTVLCFFKIYAAVPDTLKNHSYPVPDVNRFAADIRFLAADELEGRETGTKGETMAADYIVNALRSAGVAPAGSDGFIQPFPFNAGSYAGPNNKLLIDKKTCAANKDFYPLAYAANKSFKGKTLWVKYGVAAPGRDDYAAMKGIKGRVLVMESGMPDDIDPHSKLSAYADLRTRIDSAVARGAAAVIFINNDTTAENPSSKFSNRITPSSIPVLFVMGTAVKKLNGSTPVDVEGSTEILKNEKTGHNVVGLIDNQADFTIVIGAHYDHLGYGNESSLYRGSDKAIHNGADDNASGTAGLMELARLLKNGPYKNYNFLFIAFSGEELGLLGSNFIVKNLPVPAERLTCMLNMDMIGRLKKEDPLLIISGTGTSPFWKEAVQKSFVNGMRIKTSESGMGPSDHASFYMHNLPVLHFFSGTHDDYHKPSDDADKVNYDGGKMILEFMLQIIGQINSQAEKLAFTKTVDSNNDDAPRFKVTLGVVPDYGFDGSGMRIDGVSEGKPAKAAGLQAGDVVVKIGDFTVTDMMSYMKALGQFTKGDKTMVTFTRMGESMSREVQF